MTSVVVGPPDWIASVCARFAEATGWTLRYAPCGADPPESVRARLAGDADCCWRRDVGDGESTAGVLYLELPGDARQDRNFAAVRSLADTAGDLLERSLTAERLLETRTREVSTLVDIGLSLPQTEDLPQSLRRLLRAGVQLTGFRSTAFFLLDPQAETLRLRACHPTEGSGVPREVRPLSEEPPDLAAFRHRTAVVRRSDGSRAADWLPPEAGLGVCTAVSSDVGPMGTLWAYDRRGRLPGDRELHVLQSIAAQVAAVLERAVLLRESASQLRLQRELEVCSESTRGGEVASLIGPDAGFEAAGACTSRYEIGGDLCELVPLGPGRTVVAVGDASGDSIPAALVMSSVRGALRTLSQVDEIEPAERTDRIVQRLSRSLYDLTPAHQFMSLFHGLYDRATRTLTYTNAGHPTPLLLHDGQISTLNSHGMLLGVLPDATYERSSLVLSPGDVLVLYSDGVSEAMSRRRQMFRSDGIVGALRGQADRSARELFERIWNGLAEHVAGHEGGDDRTLLVLKIREGR